MSSHPLTNLETQIYYQNELKINGAYSRYNLSKIKDGAYVINLDKFESIGAHWIVLYMNGNNIVYFDSFGIEHIPKGNKNITNIYRIPVYDSIMYEYLCI